MYGWTIVRFIALTFLVGCLANFLYASVFSCILQYQFWAAFTEGAMRWYSLLPPVTTTVCAPFSLSGTDRLSRTSDIGMVLGIESSLQWWSAVEALVPCHKCLSVLQLLTPLDCVSHQCASQNTSVHIYSRQT